MIKMIYDFWYTTLVNIKFNSCCWLISIDIFILEIGQFNNLVYCWLVWIGGILPFVAVYSLLYLKLADLIPWFTVGCYDLAAY